MAHAWVMDILFALALARGGGHVDGQWVGAVFGILHGLTFTVLAALRLGGGVCPWRVFPFVVVVSNESGSARSGRRTGDPVMHDLLAAPVMATHTLARSAMPDAPVVPVKRHRSGKHRLLPFVRVLARRTGATAAQEELCAT
jgi:hypothetical protein